MDLNEIDKQDITRKWYFNASHTTTSLASTYLSVSPFLTPTLLSCLTHSIHPLHLTHCTSSHLSWITKLYVATRFAWAEHLTRWCRKWELQMRRRTYFWKIVLSKNSSLWWMRQLGAYSLHHRSVLSLSFTTSCNSYFTTLAYFYKILVTHLLLALSIVLIWLIWFDWFVWIDLI